MRHCENETVECYEAIGKDLSEVLRDIASSLDVLHYTWASLNATVTEDGNHLVTVDLHS